MFLFQRTNYKGKHVLITGGSSGIGLALALEYSMKGAHVTIVARDKIKLKLAADNIRKVAKDKDSQYISALSIDTSRSYDIVAHGLKEVLENIGAVDILVNCAGTSIADEFEKLKHEDIEKMIRTNLLGSIYPTQVVLAGMKKQGWGRIVFVASQVAQTSIHGFTAYGASKWALRGLAEALQMEVKPYGIYVSVSYPPDTDTPGYREEMLSKPDITRKLSESGSVFKSEEVAKDILTYSEAKYFGISTGLDGWLLKQLHPGMTPINNFSEVFQQILFSGFARLISVFYVLSWDREIQRAVHAQQQARAGNAITADTNAKKIK